MEHSDTPDSPPVSGNLPTTQGPASTGVATIDAHGFDPADYQWVPVLKKRRADGWSPYKQRAFIEALADTGSVATAAQGVNMSPTSAYRLRRSPGAEGFAAAWDAAIEQASRMLVDLAFERAVNGSEEPVFDKEGRRVGRRMKQNDRLLMFLMRAHAPDRYRFAHRDTLAADEVLPSALPSVAEAIARLDPIMPAEPHLLMPPEERDTALQSADILDGRLPHWRRDPDLVEIENREMRIAPGKSADMKSADISPLGERFEELLEEAKRVASGTASPYNGDWDEEE